MYAITLWDRDTARSPTPVPVAEAQVLCDFSARPIRIRTVLWYKRSKRSRWPELDIRLEMCCGAFWGSRLRGADIDTLSPDLQLRDSGEGFDRAELKTRHMG